MIHGLKGRLLSGAVMFATVGMASTAVAQTPEGKLVIAINQEPQDLGAQGIYKEVNATGLRNVLEGLIAIDPATGEMIPVLATAWERVDGSTLRMTIREGVTFHDGSPLDAAAVATSINWVWSPENAFTIQEYAGPGVITAEAIDAMTIEVTSSEPDPLLEFRMTLGGVSSAVQLAEAPERHFDTPIGTGPYVFDEWQRGQYWSADVNPDWWGLTADDAYGTTTPDFAELQLVFRTENAARVAMVQSGEAQMAMFPSSSECDRAADENAYDCVTGPSTTYLYGRLDHSLHADPILQDPRIREAVFLGLDIKGLVGLIGLASVPQGQLGTKEAIGFNEDLSPYPYDPERAMALLAEAKADGVDISSLNIEIVGRDSTPRISTIVQAMGAMLQGVGIGNEVRVQTPQEFNPRVRIGGYANEPNRQMMQIHVKQNPSGDYGLLLLSNFACPEIDDPTGPARSSVYCDADFDAALEAAMGLYGDERDAAMQALVKAIHDRHLTVPLALLDRGYLVESGIEFTFGTDHRIQAVYINKVD
ncbi:peptide/nickel transport system substrate-binding protein [Loktanella ponticola]|uniref:Peptide/nickel transport system substrate-binding protein n=1 Tax=Yoonia ponticola TaxID=1524255 RepID=A0A7W9F168_9RHOB|nr:ABC transporter substrate-binding protein [Yoonia ponticola]MBB5723671.1 peptide/nickel transport system substrate-binding protein [Yoonia ponticola]